MFVRLVELCCAALIACSLTASVSAVANATDDGIIRVKSSYSIGETIDRLKQDIAAKGIRFFSEIDQSKLAADAGIMLQPSVLLIFGNPPLERNSSRPIPTLASTGRCGSLCSRMRRVKCGPPTPLLTGSPSGTESAIARISSRWRRA